MSSLVFIGLINRNWKTSSRTKGRCSNFLRAQVITTQLTKSLLVPDDNMTNNVNNSILADNDSISRCSNNAGEENQINHSALMAMHTVIVVFAPVAVVGNAVVLAAIWKRSFQRTTFHILLSVLALTDLCTGISSALISVPYLLYSVWNNTTSIIGMLCTTYLVSETVLVITLVSIERWLHMTRRSLLTPRRGCPIAAISLILPIPFVTFNTLALANKRFMQGVGVAISAYMASCFLCTFVAYYKIFQIIREHKQRIDGQPAFNLAKYKKSVVTILYILVLFSICFAPTIVSLLLLSLYGENRKTWTVHYVSSTLLFSSSSVNPGLYIWRMKDVRDGVKSLFCKS